MGIDLGKIASAAAAGAGGLTHPRDVFNSLPSKAKGYDYLRGPQDQVLDQWDKRRTERDVVIKMNTGGGKTIVGLVAGKSALNEGAGPVAYLVPDHYLADQVVIEAARLGIETTDNPRSHLYSSGRAIYVDVFQRMFNGRSVFGVMGSSGRPVGAGVVTPGLVIIDDAHACLQKAEQAFRLRVPSSEPAYDTLLDLFDDALDQQSPAGLLGLRAGLYSAIQQVPHWSWVDRQQQVLEALHPLGQEEPHIFSWPLLADVLPLCRAAFTSEGLEIAAPCLPVHTLMGFQLALRRLYLTATLADDGVLVTDFAADPGAVANPIVPSSAGDIGDRLILVPQQTYPKATSDELRDMVVELSKQQTVVVIVPSFARAEYWTPHASRVLSKDNLAEGIDAMRQDPSIGLVVLVNRYDGVDLPGDACHVLVIDGLPEALDGIERLDEAQLMRSNYLVARQVQRLEQGMGRATRSNEDHCVVLLFGERLAERLHAPSARACFSPATRAQLDLSEQIARALEGSPLYDLGQVIEQCLARDPGWVAASRAVLAPLRYGEATVGSVATSTRSAFDLAVARNFRAAAAALQPALDSSATDPIAKGYLLQQMSAYQHHVDPAEAQQTQRAANALNHNMLRPIAGVVYQRLSAPTLEQGAAASAYLQSEYQSATDLLIGFNAMLADLVWGPRTRAFEEAWAALASHLGLAGQMPERDTGRGPDGLWALIGGTFWVCEIKSDSKPNHPVYRNAAEQLSNSMDWFRQEYPSMTGTPVLVSPKATFERQAAVPTGCRVVDEAKLDALRDSLTRLATSLADQDAFRDPTRVGQLLSYHGLIPRSFITQHTVAARPGA